MRKFHNRDFVWMEITNPGVARVFGIFANRCLSCRTPIGREVFSLVTRTCHSAAVPGARAATITRPMRAVVPTQFARCAGRRRHRPPVAFGRCKIVGHDKGECSALQTRSRLPWCHRMRHAKYCSSQHMMIGGETLSPTGMQRIGTGIRDRISSATTDYGKSF